MAVCAGLPFIDVLKTKVIELDKEIVLPVLRNSGKLAEGDELCLHTEKKDKAQQGEPLRAAPSKIKMSHAKVS